jgi:hypothetical protein
MHVPCECSVETSSCHRLITTHFAVTPLVDRPVLEVRWGHDAVVRFRRGEHQVRERGGSKRPEGRPLRMLAQRTTVARATVGPRNQKPDQKPEPTNRSLQTICSLEGLHSCLVSQLRAQPPEATLRNPKCVLIVHCMPGHKGSASPRIVVLRRLIQPGPCNSSPTLACKGP